MKTVRDFGTSSAFFILVLLSCFFESGCGGGNNGGGMNTSPAAQMSSTLTLIAHFEGSTGESIATKTYSFRTTLSDPKGKTLIQMKSFASVRVDLKGNPITQDVDVTKDLPQDPSFSSWAEVWVLGSPETSSKTEAVWGMALGSVTKADMGQKDAVIIPMKTPMNRFQNETPTLFNMTQAVQDIVETPPTNVACEIIAFFLAFLDPGTVGETESAFFTFLRTVVQFFNTFFQCVIGSTCETPCSVSEGIICPAKNMDCINNCCVERQENNVCGDGIVNGKELCDVGNGGTDTCHPGTCNGQICRCCGDGICDTPYGEDHNNCPADCAATGCGNGKLDPGEVCDWAMQTDELLKICPFLGCSNTCDSCCGDGKTTGTEQCDDGSPNFCDVCGDGCCGCTVRLGFSCDNTAQPSLCQFTGAGGITCGDCLCDIALGENDPNGHTLCHDDCTFCNNNGTCEPELGENVAHCYADCHCGDQNCDESLENHATCPSDCLCNPNGVCERDAGENCVTCPVDCDVCFNCGDGIKQEYEACDTSLADPLQQGECPDGKFCNRFCACTVCGNGSCDGPGETHISCGDVCKQDCAVAIDSCDILGSCECWVCGNDRCESVENGYPPPGETITNCPKDCDVPPPQPPPPPDCSPGSGLCNKINCAPGSTCTLNEAQNACICVVK